MCQGVPGTCEQGRRGPQLMVHRLKLNTVEAEVLMVTLPSCKHSVSQTAR